MAHNMLHFGLGESDQKNSENVREFLTAEAQKTKGLLYPTV